MLLYALFLRREQHMNPLSIVVYTNFPTHVCRYALTIVPTFVRTWNIFVGSCLVCGEILYRDVQLVQISVDMYTNTAEVTFC